MPIPENIVRVNVNWSLPLEEIAVNSLHFRHQHEVGNDLDWEGDMTQRYADLVRDGIAQAWPSLGTFFNNGVKLRDVSAYHLGTDGKTLHKKTALPPQGGLVGLAAANSLPMECALVVSLYGYDVGEYDPEGGRKRGRIYLPPMAVTKVDGLGFLSNPGQLMTAVQDWLGYCHNRAMGGEIVAPDRARLAVLSRRFGTTSDVAQVRIDNVFDVQRRRQNGYPRQALAAPLSTDG